MRLVIQRVKNASVTVAANPVAAIGNGIHETTAPPAEPGGAEARSLRRSPAGMNPADACVTGCCQSSLWQQPQKPVAAIGNGLLVLVGFGREDDSPAGWKKIEAALAKMPQLRIFPDAGNHMNLSLTDHGGDILLVSQFTLYADCKKGRRPSFHLACPPDTAEALFAKVCARTEELLPGKVQSGIFAADMDVALTNWGPVTIILDSADF